MNRFFVLSLAVSTMVPASGRCQNVVRSIEIAPVSASLGEGSLPALAPSAVLPSPSVLQAYTADLHWSLLGAEAPMAEASPSVRLEALSAALAPDFQAVSKSGASEDVEGLGRGIINKVLNQADAPVVSGAPAPALAVASQYDILGKMGLREKILTGGGVKLRADGSIEPVAKPIRFYALDNDDNLIYYRTKIYVRHKLTGVEVGIPTAEFAEVRPYIGKSGKYGDYQFFDTDKPYGGSYRDFRDVNDPEIFIKDMTDAVTSRRDGSYRGPSFFNYIVGQNNPAEAPWIAIVTSRGHKPASMVKGFQANKLPAPREELIFGVSSDELGRILPKNMGTPEKKVEVLIELLDLLESIPMVDQKGIHSFGFSDDDLDMITRVKARLTSEQLGKNRWPHVKLVLYSTGSGNEAVTVIRPAASKPRP